MSIAQAAPPESEALGDGLPPPKGDRRVTVALLSGLVFLIALIVVAVVLAAQGSNPKDAATPGRTLHVGLREFKVSGGDTSVKPGKYRFTIVNNGTIEHELLVMHSDLAPSALPLTGDDIDENGAGVNLISDGDNIKPGGSQFRTVDLTAPGTYLLVCNIPGHFHAGMFEQLTVG